MTAGLPLYEWYMGGLFVVGDKTIIKAELDNEWVQLVLEAKNLGIEKEEIRSFLLGLTSEKSRPE